MSETWHFSLADRVVVCRNRHISMSSLIFCLHIVILNSQVDIYIYDLTLFSILDLSTNLENKTREKRKSEEIDEHHKKHIEKYIAGQG